jgi:HD-like signal output (HDOD) protein
MDNFKNLPHDSLSVFWEKSMRVAQWSKNLSQFSGKADVDEFFLAGFLHNIGELILGQYFPDDARKIEEMVKSGKPQIECEIKTAGCDHADIGSYLLSLWQLSPAAVQASMLHHHPRIHLQQMSGILVEAKIVNMAVAIVDSDTGLTAFGQGMQLGQVVQDYKSILSIDYRRITEMRTQVEETVAELMRWFSV